MALFNSEAFILDAVDLQESDRIVTFLSRDFGKVRGVASSARRKYSRFQGQLQALAKVRATWFEKEGRELVRISSIEILRPPQSVFEDLEGILLGACLAGHLLEFAQEHEDSDDLFRLLDSTVEALGRGIDRALAMRFFEAWVLRLSGVFPPPRVCPSCGAELPRIGAALGADGEALQCRSCAGPSGFPVSAEALAFLDRIGRENLAKLNDNPPTGDVLGEVEEIAGQVRRSFLQHELKSYVVLRQTLRSLEARS